MSVSDEEVTRAGAKIEQAGRVGLSAMLCAWPFAVVDNSFALVTWAVLFSGGRIVRAIERASNGTVSATSDTR